MSTDEMYGKVVSMSPVMAKHYLSKSIGNRPISEQRVKTYMLDMANDKWTLTPAIIFDSNGNLADGHHRLKALADMPDKLGINKRVDMFVIYNLPFDSRVNLDRGRSRPESQALFFKIGRMPTMTEVSIAKVLLRKYHKQFTSIDDQARILMEHGEAIEFAMKARTSSIRGINAYVLAAIARAYYHVPKETLESFIDELKGTEKVTNSVVSFLKSKFKHAYLTEKEKYLYTERAIDSYNKGESTTHIIGVDELFPLPEE